MLPSLQALRAFDAAARFSSFRKAADSLRVTPTAISHHIRGLEDHLGVQLFLREGRKVVLTDDGRRLAETTDRAFGILTETVHNLKRTNRKVVRVAAGPIFTARWLMPRISEFWEDNLGIDLEVVPTWRPGSLEHSEVDIAIQWQRFTEAPQDANKVLELTPIAIASPAFLDRYGPIDEPARLLDVPILHQRNHWGWLDWFASMGVQHSGQLRGAVFEDANVLLRGAAEGQGAIVGWLPLIEQDLREGRVVQLFDECIKSTHAYYLEVQPGRQSHQATARVKTWLLAQAIGFDENQTRLNRYEN